VKTLEDPGASAPLEYVPYYQIHAFALTGKTKEVDSVNYSAEPK